MHMANAKIRAATYALQGNQKPIQEMKRWKLTTYAEPGFIST